LTADRQRIFVRHTIPQHFGEPAVASEDHTSEYMRSVTCRRASEALAYSVGVSP
jgi:hypothetical protein